MFLFLKQNCQVKKCLGWSLLFACKSQMINIGFGKIENFSAMFLE